MLTKLDWISFSFFRAVGSADRASDEFQLVLRGLSDLLDDVFPHFMGQGDWTLGKGRAPYEASYSHPSGGVVLFWHSHLDHALVEVSGKGCDWMEQELWWHFFLERVQPRVTRLDVACDILTKTDPLSFASQRDSQRFRSHSEFVSESGTTAYVGSRTSNRYARCYRYNPPHERSHFLRVEHVVKAEDAKATLLYTLENGLEATAKRLGDGFGWGHPVWDVEASEAPELSVYRPDRKEGKTLFWLADTVAPLLRRLHDEKVIDLREWIAEHLALDD